MSDYTKFALVVAGGTGSRMNSPVAKQFMLLNGIPILMRTLDRFRQYDPQIKIILVLPSDQIAYWKTLCSTYHFDLKHTIVEGGETRSESVINGLNTITEDGIVAIHDGVRPLVSLETIDRCFIGASHYGNAVPCIHIVDSLRQISLSGNSNADRNSFVIIQTPQTFNIKDIKEAYSNHFKISFTDDATVLEKNGGTVHLVEGNRENIKITHTSDLLIAEALIRLF